MVTVVLCIAAALGADSTHLQQNPVYRQLREAGVSNHRGNQVLPAPTMPDGLTANEQARVLEQLGGARYPLERFTRKSVVAPQIIRVSRLDANDDPDPLRTVDYWFVVHAELDAISDKKLLERLLGTEEEAGDATAITAAKLAARGIRIDERSADREGYGHVEFELLKKVRLQATGHSFWSRSEQSIVAAALVDPRFNTDSDYPNQWSLVERATADSETGAVHPYQGAGLYVKITRLARPRGALFVETHIAFVEPGQWFRGTNQLGAKLPAVIQAQVRSARREMMLATRAVQTD